MISASTSPRCADESRRSLQADFVAAVAAAALPLLCPVAAIAAVNVDRLELSGGNLRIEGDRAVAGSTVVAQSSNDSASASADGKGEFRIEASGFTAPDCTVSVDDGTGAVVATIAGCTPEAEPPPPPPPPPPNQAPVASAGPDVVIPDDDGDGFAIVTYDGTGSFDADGTIVSYNWNIQSTGDVSIGTAASFSINQAVGTYVVELLVVDDDNATSKDFLIVTVGDPLVAEPQGLFGVLESWQAEGSFDSPLMGASVASAGDVNGDGFDDVIVGARGYDAPGGLFDEGAAFIFLGSPEGVIGNSPFTAHAAIIGTEASSEFGSSVDGAGDVNGDGFDDIIVGAPLAGPSDLTVSGAAYVFLGSASGIVASSPADAAFVLESKQIEGHMGRGVAGAGDVNGDGFDDVIVSAGLYGKPFDPPIPNQGSGRIGASFVFLGSPNGILGNDPASAHAQILPWLLGSGDQAFSGPGSAVDGAGDINGDGYDDLIVGSSGYDNNLVWPGIDTPDPFLEGAALIFLGSPTGIDPLSPAARIEGNALESAMGAAVAAAGDVNGDGFDDVIIGAPFYPAGDPLLLAQEGAVFIFHGSPAGITATDALQADAAFFGAELAEWVGRSVTGLGSINGDAFADIAFGARTFPGAIPEDGEFNGSRALSGEGIAYVYYGSSAGIVGTGLSDAALRYVSGQEAGSAGFDVGSGGDVNGDGLQDIVIGVPGWTGTRSREGAAFVDLSGGTAAPPPPPLPPPPPANLAPVADAGPDQTVLDSDGDGSELVSYDGSGSFDPDGTIVSWVWTVSPIGNMLGNQEAFTVRQSNGSYIVELTVTDDMGATASDVMTVKIEAPPPPSTNLPPLAVAPADLSVVDTDNDGFASVQLDGTGSSDPDGSIAAYEWRLDGSLIGTGAIQGAAFPLGANIVTLTVIDNAGASASDTVTITVTAAATPPSATISITGPATISRGDTASFAATVTNNGAATLTNASVGIAISPNRRIRNLSPAGSIALGDLAPGASRTVNWSGRADREGSATATVSITAAGTVIDTASHTFSITR